MPVHPDENSQSTPSNMEIQEQINLSLKSLASIISDLRHYIFDLRRQAFSRIPGIRAKRSTISTRSPRQVGSPPVSRIL